MKTLILLLDRQFCKFFFSVVLSVLVCPGSGMFLSPMWQFI